MSEMKEAITEAMGWSHRLGLALGSGSDVFVNGEIYDVEQIMDKLKESDAKVQALLEEAGAA